MPSSLGRPGEGVRFTDFSLWIGEQSILAEINLSVARGEVLALVGASGAGKTALLRALLGLSPTGARRSGRLEVAGNPVQDAGEREWRRLRGRVVGWMPQDPLAALPAHRTVGGLIDEVLLGTPDDRGRRARGERAKTLLDSVGLDPVLACRYPHQLSGGQGQRVLLALALAADPCVLLADEPTSALDPVAAVALEARLVAEAREQRRAVLLVSHDLAAAARSADRVAVLAGGRLVECGPARTVLTRPRHPYVAGLLAARPLGRTTPQTPLGVAPVSLACAPREAGCGFRRSCSRADIRCQTLAPTLSEFGAVAVACHHPMAAP
jgi:oligopeptide/dipeptide ABC transporter ATP-binding protein